jgi:hypothetical protein
MLSGAKHLRKLAITLKFPTISQFFVSKEISMNEQPNELDSMCGISDDELTKRFKEAVRIDNEIKRIKGTPIAGYDTEKKMAYLEYADGHREYIHAKSEEA